MNQLFAMNTHKFLLLSLSLSHTQIQVFSLLPWLTVNFGRSRDRTTFSTSTFVRTTNTLEQLWQKKIYIYKDANIKPCLSGLRKYIHSTTAVQLTADWDEAADSELQGYRAVFWGSQPPDQWRIQNFFSGGGFNKFSWGQRVRGSGGGSPLVRGSTQFANEWNPYSD
jgi:hypothetical protein